MKRFLSNRIDAVAPSGIREFFDLVLESEDIISLGVGEPDFVTPWSVRDEAIYRIEKGFLSYTSNKGLTALRHAISDYLMRQFSIKYGHEEILIRNGVSGGMDLFIGRTINNGDELILLEPGYVFYRPLFELLGEKVCELMFL